MGISPYLSSIRAKVGTALLVVPSVTGIVFDEHQRVLLVRQRDLNIWSTPGGAIEPNETPANAVVREVWEETGLRTEPVRLLGVFGGPQCMVTYPNGDQVTYVTSVFECRVCSGTLRDTTEETNASQYVDASTFAQLDLTPWAAFIVPTLLGARDTPPFEPASWTPPD
ncbi:MAG: NUDIX domain-containing protein [Vicinamibacterales bacterium]